MEKLYDNRKKIFRKFEIKENYSNIIKLKNNIKWFPRNDYLDVIENLLIYEWKFESIEKIVRVFSEGGLRLRNIYKKSERKYASHNDNHSSIKQMKNI